MSSIQALTKYSAEDWILFLTPILSAVVGFNLGGIIPGVGGFVLGAVIGSLSKTLTGLGQNPSFKSNYEDWLSFIITFLGFLASAASANSNYVIYGTVIGFIAKALPSMAGGPNVEDILLTIGAVISGVAEALGYPNVAVVGLFLSTVGKSLPSLTASAPAAAATAPATATTAAK